MGGKHKQTNKELNKMEITTKKEAMKISLDTLFDGPKTATTIERYDMAKYMWRGSLQSYVGEPIKSPPSNVLAVWAERRQDKDGPYVILKCLTKTRS